jgi:DNA-binding transcriptional regulator YiaG
MREKMQLQLMQQHFAQLLHLPEQTLVSKKTTMP